MSNSEMGYLLESFKFSSASSSDSQDNMGRVTAWLEVIFSVGGCMRVSDAPSINPSALVPIMG